FPARPATPLFASQCTVGARRGGQGGGTKVLIRLRRGAVSARSCPAAGVTACFTSALRWRKGDKIGQTWAQVRPPRGAGTWDGIGMDCRGTACRALHIRAALVSIGDVRAHQPGTACRAPTTDTWNHVHAASVTCVRRPD